MSKYLLIVESPAKASTIKKYLGNDFEVLASYGHVRDLPSKNGAVDVENNFAMNFQQIERNVKHVKAISDALKKAEVLYLATDPDREGEAISWHIYELMRAKKTLNLKKQKVYRVVFHEITKNSIKEAIANPREISMNLVEAQQARLALDYLVGFNLSPLLWKKISYGLSAGRVQSPALRMIVERELEIEAFKAQEYWTIESDLEWQTQKFVAKLTTYQQKKLTQFSIANAEQATNIEKDLLKLAQGILEVVDINKKQRKRHPAPPFITSTLQQESARKLGFSARDTMKFAQQLYEGIDLGQEGRVGLITYMRTDSVNLAQEAVEEIRQVIVKKYGKNRLPSTPNFYKTKAKNAQEAHEAIRPTSAMRVPEEVKSFLSKEQFKLYNLIWQRTIASQMISAILNIVGVDLICGNKDNIFRANGSTIAEMGFMQVYKEGSDETSKDDNSHKTNANNSSNSNKTVDNDEETFLPELKVGDKVTLEKIRSEQHFTAPPPRYTEASLIKTLEEYGIGRPSTYATIIHTLLMRKYVTLEAKKFHPTEIARLVIRFLTNHFATYVDYDFTAKLEDKLDSVALGENKWIPVLQEFWQPFHTLVNEIELTVQRKEARQELLDKNCPKCRKQLALRLSKNGAFVGCTGYPECDYTAKLMRNENGQEEIQEISHTVEVVPDRLCPQCNSPLHIKTGRYNKFIGCSNYPKCKYVESLNDKDNDTGITCPECKKGHLIKKRSRFKTFFYACSNYPKCKYAVSSQPIAETCPKCKWPILMIKTTKRYGTQKVCPQKSCDYVENIAENVAENED